MANELITNYAEYLKNKFPQCKVELTDFPKRQESLISVSWHQGENWFEMPAVFNPDITKWDEAELAIWEAVISERLGNEGRLINKQGEN